jgi:hypothetical protein
METNQLIDELKSRGYYTDLLFCREDVLNQLQEVNDGNVNKIVLTEEDMDEILDSHINVGWLCERINESIYNGIINDFCES